MRISSPPRQDRAGLPMCPRAYGQTIAAMATTTATRYVYDFDEGSREMRAVLGGKGANLAEMSRVLGPGVVPAGFTITTTACVDFMRAGREEPPGLADQVADGIARLEQSAGRALGDPADPLL